MLEARYEIGYGLMVQLSSDGSGVQQIHVGSARFMALEGIALPEELQSIAADCRERGTALVWVARDGVIVGAIELEATIRPETQALVAALKRRGMEIFIISGDQEAPTRHLAELLGMDGYFANTLPDQKASLVKELQEKGRKVCFVGDGINDAIALRQADVSISMAGATTAAIDTAQVVLMGGDLGRILTLIELVESMHTNLDQNYKTLIALSLLAAGGVLFFHAGFLVIGLIQVASVAAAIGIANKKIPTTSTQSLKVLHGENRSSR
jgi:Cu2+-exporting ATPase